MIFPRLELESIVQVNDKTRLDATKSFATQNEADIFYVGINPDGAGYIDVTEDKYLDWQFGASGASAITVKVQVGNVSGASAVFAQTIDIVTEAQDYLFSSDFDLQLHEPDILKWVKDGRATFKDMHRRAQTVIMQWIGREGFINSFGNRYIKTNLKDIEEVRQLSIYTTLRLIFEGISNATDDIFHEKAVRYSALENKWKGRSKVSLTVRLNDDDEEEIVEEIDTASGFVARR